MSAPKETKSLVFKENEYKFPKICSIGYNNSLNTKTGDFLCVNRWNSLYFVRSGKATLFIHGKTYNVEKGDIFFITPNIPWHIYPENGETLTYYWMAFNAGYAREIYETLGFDESDSTVRASKSPKRVEWIFDSLMESNSATPEVYFSAMSSLMQILSAEFSKTEVSVTTAHHKELTENIKQIIDINFRNPDFSVNYAAQMLYISHAQMTRVFKEVMGVTPISYLVDLRLNFAAEKAREKNISVTKLCEESGFSDCGHFMKKFKQKFGVTVKEFQKKRGL